MSDDLKSAIVAIEELLNFIDSKPVFDKMSDAGCGYIDTFRSEEFDNLITKARTALSALKSKLK